MAVGAKQGAGLIDQQQLAVIRADRIAERHRHRHGRWLEALAQVAGGKRIAFQTGHQQGAVIAQLQGEKTARVGAFQLSEGLAGIVRASEVTLLAGQKPVFSLLSNRG